jgi:acyl-CoA reductase-like NAD-dependent aldehyde dehydrogenase
MDWIASSGGKVLAGGKQRGTLVTPTLIESPSPDAQDSCEEVFGPVMTLQSFADDEAAINQVNTSRFGIQCGVFTHDLRRAERYFRELEVGGVVVNDYPTLRFDNQPYGGVKQSGFGREGVRYAMDEMTEAKSLVVRTF